MYIYKQVKRNRNTAYNVYIHVRLSVHCGKRTMQSANSAGLKYQMINELVILYILLIIKLLYFPNIYCVVGVGITV